MIPSFDFDNIVCFDVRNLLSEFFEEGFEERLGMSAAMLSASPTFRDDRGFFLERAKLSCNMIQENLSRSATGVFRGLHYQLGTWQTKYVSAMCGVIIDFFVQLDPNRPDFGIVHAIRLDDPRLVLKVPKGYAHGFYCAKRADVMYIVDQEYSKNDERILSIDDNMFHIRELIFSSILYPYDPEEVAFDIPFRNGGKIFLNEKDSAGLSFYKSVDEIALFYNGSGNIRI